MHVLLLSANTGEGHNSTSKAIMDVLEEQGVDCQQRDALAYLSPKFSKFISNWHSRIYRYVPKLFDVGYGAMERSVPSDDFAPIYELLSLGAKKLYRTLLEGDYDAVICVHAFAGQMLTEVRRVWGYRVPSFFVATDYTCSPTVEQCELDGFFIPDAELTDEFLRAGLPQDRLIPCGIPVRQEFYGKQSRSLARSRLGLPGQGLIILLMCGSMGAGPLRRIAQELCQRLPPDSAVVAICGSNERLQESLLELQAPGLKVLGFTRDVASYMDAADLIVTKPGGLSSTEAANKHLPIVLLDSVGGCEKRNFEFFLTRDMALGSTQVEQVIVQAVTLANDPALRERLRLNLEARFGDNSTRNLVRHVMAEADRYRASNRNTGIILEKTEHPSYQKGGDTMENQNLTAINLARAFAGESQARTRYTIYAKVARKEGYEWIARVFEETAANEAVHAEEFLEHMQKLGFCAPNIDLDAGYPFQLGSTGENLEAAASGEMHEHDSAYPEFAEIARREGYEETARLWMQIARIEGVHHNAFRQLADQLMGGTLTKKDSPILWRCTNCGYTYESIRACDPCPVCGKGAGWQAGQLDERQLMGKERK